MVDLQVLLRACFEAELPLQTVSIHSYNCFKGLFVPTGNDLPRGLPPGFVRLKHLQKVILSEAGLSDLPDGPWLHNLKLLDLSHNKFRHIPRVLTKYKRTLQTVNLTGAVQRVARACFMPKRWEIYQELLDAGMDLQIEEDALYRCGVHNTQLPAQFAQHVRF